MWVNDKFRYSKKILRTIAENYVSLYDGLSFRENSLLTHPLEIAEYKADFDNALSRIGRGQWSGQPSNEFKEYTGYGRLQRIVIADIMGVTDTELARLKFDDIIGLKGIAYSKMCERLNRGIA